MSLLTTLSMVGCMCTPGYHSGMSPYACQPDFGCDSGCDPCGIAESDCGVIEYGGNFCAPPRIANCRNSLSNIGNGVCLIGRGLLDVTAAPFVLIGNILSSGCQYEVLAHCPDVSYGTCYPMQETVAPCAPCSTSGCDNCNGGYTEGIQYNVTTVPNRSVPNRTMAVLPRKNGVVQASYQEPSVPAVRFVQPR